MLGTLADDLARGIAKFRRRRVRSLPSPVKVNLGSGLHVAEGWIHVDGNIHSMAASWPRPVLRGLYRLSSTVKWIPEGEYVRRLKGHRFAHCDLEGRLPFDDATVDFVYASHVLEHFYRDDAERLAREIYRILRPGGWVRLCVPDLEHALRLYDQGDKEEALHYFFETSATPYYRTHRYMYDFDLLRGLLDVVGFVDIGRRLYREGRVPDLAVLDNRPEETLYVEATKATPQTSHGDADHE